MTNYANARNYIRDDAVTPQSYNASFLGWQGTLERFKSNFNDPDDYAQCKAHYKKMDPTMKTNFVTNVASSLSTAMQNTQKKSFGEYTPSTTSNISTAALLTDLGQKFGTRLMETWGS
jgi:catalase